MRFIISTLLLAAAVLPNLAQTAAQSAAPDALPPKPAFSVALIDKGVSPCDNFYKHACGGWMKANPIPADQPSWGRFNEVYERNRLILRAVLEKSAAVKDAPAGSLDQKIGDYYGACLDEAAADAAGAAPLAGDFQAIAGLKDASGLIATAARLQRRGVNALFGAGSITDAKDSTLIITAVGQGGLGLPERDYYLRTDKASATMRAKYLTHLTRMFSLLGDPAPRAAANARTVMSLETKLAKISMSNVDQRDPKKTYNPEQLGSLQAWTPQLDWPAYFKALGVANPTSINVMMPGFFSGLNGLVKSVPLSQWKTYLRWHVAHAQASRLSKGFVNENFDFYNRTLYGAPTLQPRWKRCVRASMGDLGEMLGHAYVDAAFSGDAKDRMLKMVKNLYVALNQDIPTLDWMDETTQARAKDKLASFGTKIGYPDKWVDYSSLQFGRASWAANHAAAAEFEFQRDLDKIGKPVDPTEWLMIPHDVNAYYRSDRNEIVFPAGILQPPFFDPEMDDAVNYGGIGMVIGHEITHGFDDSGRQFDASGNLNDWWSESSGKAFDAKAACVGTQYEAFEPLPGLHINGQLTMGENIADLGGLKIAYKALEASFKGNPPPPRDGLTWQQRFFLGAAQGWCDNSRDEALKSQILEDPHSPSEYRLNGPLANFSEFRSAFSCPAGMPMVRKPEEVCKIW